MKVNMNCVTKAVSVSLILAQLSFSVPAFGAGNNGSTPEESLLGEIYASRGLNLSQQEREQSFKGLIQTYRDSSADETAQQREANLQEATVNLGIYTSQQSQLLVQMAKEKSAEVGDEVGNDPDEFAKEVTEIVAEQPKGAQFSLCSTGAQAGNVILGLTGVAFGIFGLAAGKTCPAGFSHLDGEYSSISSNSTVECASNSFLADPSHNKFQSTGYVRTSTGKDMMYGGLGAVIVALAVGIYQINSCH